jgi:hypothetical protein
MDICTTGSRVRTGGDRVKVPYERTRHMHTLVELVLLPLLCIVRRRDVPCLDDTP